MNKLAITLASCVFLTATSSALAADAKPNATFAKAYVKLDVSYKAANGQTYSNICGGVFISEDIVLTASHCISDEWAKASSKAISFQYGTNFATTAKLRAGQSWAKFDPKVDLALVRMNKSSANVGLVKALDAACPKGPQHKYPTKAIVYKRMNDTNNKPLAQNTYHTSTTTISSHGKSPLANGQAYKALSSGVGGDSGSPVFLTNGTIVGIYNGNGGSNSYFATLCAYRSDISTHGQKLLKLK
jgi:V8-like Glu-specific endopeptidase